MHLQHLHIAASKIIAIMLPKLFAEIHAADRSSGNERHTTRLIDACPRPKIRQRLPDGFQPKKGRSAHNSLYTKLLFQVNVR